MCSFGVFLTCKQQTTVQVCEHNRVRRILGDKSGDKRIMGDLRVDVGLKDF